MNVAHADSSPDLRVSADAGFSLLEVLIASLLLLIIALGLVPLFTRAMLDNASGKDATTATNFDRSQLETLNAIPFDFAPLAIANGQTVLETQSSFSRGTANIDNDSGEVWSPGIIANPASTRWTRTVRVRQYGVGDLIDGNLDTPLPGEESLCCVQIKEIEVSVKGGNQGSVLGSILAASNSVTFRTLRSI